MCGLTGVIYKNQNGMNSIDVTIFEEMLYIDALRGDDSTGVGVLYNDGEMRLLKEAVTPASYFLASTEWASVRSDTIRKGKVLIGHNRKATKGSIKDETAHPWLIEDRYLFMHNGTLYNHKELHDTEVDSEALGMHLAACEGDIKKLEEALGKVNGAYACVWIDQQKERLYMIRNKDRPLWLANCNFITAFCSEPVFIQAACGRNNTKVESYESLDVDTLYEWDLTKASSLDFVKTKLEIKKARPILTVTPRKNGQRKSTNTEVMDSTAAGTINFTEGASKNSFKRFRRKYVGSKLHFWCDDCFASSVPSSVCSRWVILGEVAELEETLHQVHGMWQGDLPNGGLQGRLMEGVIYDVTWDHGQRKFDIWVKGPKVNQYFETVMQKYETKTTQH